MLKHLLLKKVPSPLDGDTQLIPLYKAIAFLSIPCAFIALAMLGVFFG